MDVIREKLKLLPENPGVYIMLDKYSNVIYVGKARVLKNRVRQYFHNSPKPEKVMKMVENISDFNYIITNSEIDALALENNLIKKYKPKYNILLKDDKTYPYIKADLRVRTVRDISVRLWAEYTVKIFWIFYSSHSIYGSAIHRLRTSLSANV